MVRPPPTVRQAAVAVGLPADRAASLAGRHIVNLFSERKLGSSPAAVPPGAGLLTAVAFLLARRAGPFGLVRTLIGLFALLRAGAFPLFGAPPEKLFFKPPVPGPQPLDLPVFLLVFGPEPSVLLFLLTQLPPELRFPLHTSLVQGDTPTGLNPQIDPISVLNLYRVTHDR